ncbi:hypothetical protein DL237_10025 [Pseudooceanicola sediminis]|uniref:Uncharacterized protein n=1 Tax=Pseudooceanicola sediminis TaxID=2211117 RepID=A0A399J8N9_9RHOB|nr:hypothetical protein DL237_10025 [Pseudooceanicola sediminis]
MMRDRSANPADRDQQTIQHMSSAARLPVSDIYVLCARLSSNGRCACSVRGRDRCAGLRELLARHGSVEAALHAEIQRMERAVRRGF